VRAGGQSTDRRKRNMRPFRFKSPPTTFAISLRVDKFRELQTYRRNTEFYAKWLLKVIQSQFGVRGKAIRQYK